MRHLDPDSESYGRLSKTFLAFITEPAERADRVDSLEHVCLTGEASKTRARYARWLRLRWMRLTSLNRVRTIAVPVRSVGLGGEGGGSGCTKKCTEGLLPQMGFGGLK